MPQIRLEYSANLDNQLDTRNTLMRLNTALVDSGLFNEIDIKSRTFRCEDFLIGRFEEGHAFAHLQIIILTGREPSVKADLSKRMLATLAECITPLEGVQTQLAVQILDNDRECYMKQSV
jgi:5-carboxymethyl-2-hydroxymuconate isomerase